jgi:hypothetical protein
LENPTPGQDTTADKKVPGKLESIYILGRFETLVGADAAPADIFAVVPELRATLP